MPCREAILSEETYDYITDFPVETLSDLSFVVCTEEVNDVYGIIYVDNDRLPNLENNFFDYQGIPKLYGLMQVGDGEPLVSPMQAEPFDPASLIASGITQVQAPPLSLTGRGTLICMIDTGIDYVNPLFRDELGNTRIEAIWDQTIQTGNAPDGLRYGTEYTREQINQALRAENPREIVPSMDENGHGTALASVAAGSIAGMAAMNGQMAGSQGSAYASRIPAGFQGAAPDAGLVIVKLKPAKQYLRNYYLLPSQVPAYQENDIMLAVKYCERFIRTFNRPVIICIGLGTSYGAHSGTSPLSAYLNSVAIKRGCAVVVCGGNEGNAGGHFRGNFVTLGTDPLAAPGTVQTNSRDVEIRVADGNGGFYAELWGKRTNVLNVSVRSPGGETIPPIPLGLRQSITFDFVYEKTKVTIYSTLVEPTSGDELIFFRIVDPTPGIWTIRVIGQADGQNGVFDLWLPITQFQQSRVYFLSPVPDGTLTEPAMALNVISTSTYNAANGSFYIDSGRGFTRNNDPKPDLAAPGVEISTVYGKQSGASFAAAITAGAVAQFMQWAVVEGNNPYADSRVVKGYLIRGAKRSADNTYPSREWGYGKLDMVGVFTSLRS